MDLPTLAVISLAVLLYAVSRRRLDHLAMTPPMAFVLLGVLTGTLGLNIIRFDAVHGIVHVIGVLTLVLVLFTDADRISPGALARRHVLPQRLLLIGLPLTVLAGTLLAWLLWPELSLWEAALIGAILAPTDPALSQTVVTGNAVPVRIRQALNVESGLNDGIALPIVLAFAAFAGTSTLSAATFLQLTTTGLLQLALGPMVGVAVGLAGGKIAGIAFSTRSEHSSYEGLAVLAIAVLAYASAQLLGGNGFLAAFAAGLTFGSTFPRRSILKFMEVEGQLLTLFTFLLIGTTLFAEAWAHLDFRIIAYGVLSLTAVRMIPTALALLGTGLRWQSFLFIGWFGPRGLASVLFLLLIIEQDGLVHDQLIMAVVISTVVLSVFAHGVSSRYFSRIYGRTVKGFGPCEESVDMEEIPTRHR